MAGRASAARPCFAVTVAKAASVRSGRPLKGVRFHIGLHHLAADPAAGVADDHGHAEGALVEHLSRVGPGRLVLPRLVPKAVPEREVRRRPRPGRSTTPATPWARCLQHPRHLRRIRSRPTTDANERGHGPGQGEGKIRGKQPKLSPKQQRELVRMAGTGEYTIADLAELFTVSRTTVYRTLQRDTATAEQDRR